MLEVLQAYGLLLDIKTVQREESDFVDAARNFIRTLSEWNRTWSVLRLIGYIWKLHDTMEEAPPRRSFYEVSKSGKRAKKRRVGWDVGKSRKRCYRSKRVAYMDSGGIVRFGRVIHTKLWSEYIGAKQTEVIDLVTSIDDESDGESSAVAECAPNLANVVDLCIGSEEENEPVEWPPGIVRLYEYQNSGRIQFLDAGDSDPCGCEDSCDPEECLNALSDYICGGRNCSVGPGCGNRAIEAPNVQLRSCNSGIGVFATSAIAAGTVIGPYWGALSTHNYEAEPRQYEYVMKIRTRSSTGKRVFINAEESGGVARFINHSCEASCQFTERRNRKHVDIIVVSTRNIAQDEELTVDYTDIWFRCNCGSKKCRGRDL